MSNNALNVRPTFRGSTGNVRANGLIYFYENKTVTLATIYSDEALTVEQANPYELDAYGRIPGTVKYKGTLTVKHTESDGSDPISDDDVETFAAGSILLVEQFEVVASDPLAMTVLVKTGRVMAGETLVSIADQTTTTITAPVTNPRIDRIVVNRATGVYTIVTGAEAASPTAPAITVDTMPVAQILLQTSSTVISLSMITDERVSGIADQSNVNSTETLTNKTLTSPALTSPVMTTPQINDTSSDHQYVFAVSELAADRTVTLPLLTGNDEFVFKDFIQILTNKTLTSPVLTTPQINDTSADHQYVFAVSELAADRTVTLPLLTTADEFTFNAHTQTLTNKTLTSPNINEAVALTATATKLNAITNEYTTSGTTASLASTINEEAVITHGLGTDDVIVTLLAVGNGVFNSWSGTVRHVSDYIQSFHGSPTTLAVAIAATTAATGTVKISLTNNDGGAQTISWRVHVRPRVI